MLVGILRSCEKTHLHVGWRGDADSSIKTQCWPRHRREYRWWTQKDGLTLLYHREHAVHPSFNSTTPPGVLCLPSSCHTSQKNEVRTKAHIRRAGGSTLSGVRNNWFWPSPACELKWSPWVAAYWVGCGHYTTWFQNLHRARTKASSLSEWNPLCCRLSCFFFYLIDSRSQLWALVLWGFFGLLWCLLHMSTCWIALRKLELKSSCNKKLELCLMDLQTEHFCLTEASNTKLTDEKCGYKSYFSRQNEVCEG